MTGTPLWQQRECSGRPPRHWRARGTSTPPAFPTTGTKPWRTATRPRGMLLSTQQRARRRDESAGSAIVSYGARLDGAFGVAGETTARTDGETLGEVGPQGVAQAPIPDIDTKGTVECEVHAGASDAEGRGMDASDDFEVFATRSEPVPGAAGMVGDGPGMAATGGSDSTGARVPPPHAHMTSRMTQRSKAALEKELKWPTRARARRPSARRRQRHMVMVHSPRPPWQRRRRRGGERGALPARAHHRTGGARWGRSVRFTPRELRRPRRSMEVRAAVRSRRTDDGGGAGRSRRGGCCRWSRQGGTLASPAVVYALSAPLGTPLGWCREATPHPSLTCLIQASCWRQFVATRAQEQRSHMSRAGVLVLPSRDSNATASQQGINPPRRQCRLRCPPPPRCTPPPYFISAPLPPPLAQPPHPAHIAIAGTSPTN